MVNRCLLIRRYVGLVLVLGGAVTACAAENRLDESNRSVSATPVAPEEAAVPVPLAQRAYLDPRTGRLVSEPPPGAEVLALGPNELNMLSTSHQGLVVQTLPDGSFLVDLQGRYRHMAVATVDDDGSITISEVSGEVFLPVESHQVAAEGKTSDQDH